MFRTRERIVTIIWWVGPFALATIIALELGRPFRAGAVSFDSAMAVLHFQRIVEGRHLESFVATTPKPLLTILYGPLYGLTHDWRPLVWAAILAFGVAVSLATHLARRMGGWTAGLFAAITLAGAPALLFDAALALATPWAMLFWAVAGLAVAGPRPRFAVAGLALAVASLARLETLVVVGTALAVLILVSVTPGHARRSVPRGAWWISLGLLAIPVSMVHDWRLTGDPLFWLSVSTKYTALTSNHVPTLSELAGQLGKRYLGESALVVLGVIGWLQLAGRGKWPVAIGLLGLGPGIFAFLLVLAARHIFVSSRYFAGIDVAVAFSAALGISAVFVRLPASLRAAGAKRPRVRGATSVAVIAILALVFTAGWSGIGTDLRPTVHDFTKAAVSERLALPVLREAVAAARTTRSADAVGPLLLVPSQIRPSVVVDLGLRLGDVGGTGVSPVATASLPAGLVLLHSRPANSASPDLEVSQPTHAANATIVPLLADPATGTWVVRVDGS